MADFDVKLSETSGVGVAQATPAPVKGAILGDLVEDTGEMFVKNRTEELKLAKDKLRNAALASFTDKQLRIANAVNTGQMSATQARLQFRSNVQKSIASTPALAEDFLQIHSKLMSTSGLAKSAAQQAEDLDQDINSATDRGWVTPNMTDAQKFTALQSMRTFDKQKELLAQRQAEVNYVNSQLETKSKTIGIDRAEIELNKMRRTEGSKRNLDVLADAYMPKFRSDMNTITTQLADGTMSEKDAVVAVNQAFQSVQMLINSIGSDAGRDYLTTITEPMRQMKEDTLALVKGDIDRTVYEDKVKSLIAITQLNALRSSDQFKNYVAVSRLMPNVPSEFIVNSTLVTQDLWKKMGSKDGQNGNVFDQDTSGVRTYFSGLQGAMDKSDRIGEDANREIQTHVDNVLRSIPQYASSAERVADYLPVVDFLSSPTVGKYIKEKGGIPSEYAEGANDVMQTVYERRILPMVQAEFSRAGLQYMLRQGEQAPEGETTSMNTVRAGGEFLNLSMANAPTVSAIEPVFTGSGVRFKVSEGLDPRLRNEASNKIKELNRTVSPMVNKFIRMSAHLEGHTDYRKVFEQNFNNLFSPNPEQE